MLHVAAKQNNKGIAFTEDLWSSHRTGTAWVIDKVLFYAENSFVAAVRLYLQKAKRVPVHPIGKRLPKIWWME